MATFSGWLEGGGTNNALEIYTNPDGWSQEYYAPFTPTCTRGCTCCPTGGSSCRARTCRRTSFNPATNSWQTGVAATKYPCNPPFTDCSPRVRVYGSSVLLPLSAADNWRARIMVMGGDNPATATAEIIDLSQPNPGWRYTNPMSGHASR